MTSGYYGVRRSFLSDSDFHSPKQLANDVCTSSSAAKPFACESPAAPGPAGLLDAYFPEPYADPRPPGLPPSAGSLLGASALPPLLPPPFPGDPSHLVLVSMQAPHRREAGGLGSRAPAHLRGATRWKPELARPAPHAHLPAAAPPASAPRGLPGGPTGLDGTTVYTHFVSALLILPDVPPSLLPHARKEPRSSSPT